MNVKVTGVPMRTGRMSVSDDPRVGQLVATTGPKRCNHSCTKIQRLHEDLTTRDTRSNHTTTGLALWSSLTLETGSHPWVPAGHSTVHGCLVRQGGCGWPETTTTNKKTTAHSNMVAEPWLNVQPV